MTRNITSDEARYYDQMAELIKDSPRDLLASSLLFSNRITVQSLITRYELYKMVLDMPGDIVECGVYRLILLWLAHLSVILEPYAINRRFIGFDTFEGFSSIDAERDPKDINSKNFSDTSYEAIDKALRAIDLVRPVNKIKRFELVKGDITETVPEYTKENPAFTCAMLILDTDLYQPTLTALNYIIPHMQGRFGGFDNTIMKILGVRRRL